ncbi:hypothetical protein HUU40_26430 [candidate division KSB1 bacterium]|nr:hypothetical protein [candidate division KSB1 bacterium]
MIGKPCAGKILKGMTEDCSRVTQPRIAPCAFFLKQSAAHRLLGIAEPGGMPLLRKTAHTLVDTAKWRP